MIEPTELLKALEDIDEAYVREADPAASADKPLRKKPVPRVALIAAAVAAAVAVLAVVLTLTVFNRKEPEQQTPILPAASETEKQTAEPTVKTEKTEQTEKTEKTEETEIKTTEEPTETADPTPTPTEPAEPTPTEEPTPTPTVKPKELAPLSDSDQFDYQYRNGGYLPGKHIDGFIILPEGLFRDYAILKVTKIYNDLNKDEEFKLEQRFGIRPYFTYSERYMELFGEENRENCTQIEYEVIFATHGIAHGKRVTQVNGRILNYSTYRSVEPLSQLLNEHIPVFVPNSFVDTINVGDTIICEMSYFSHGHYQQYLIAAGHDNLGVGYLPGENVPEGGFETGVLFKTENSENMYSTLERFNDPAYVWWKYSLGSNPLFVVREYVEVIESKIQNGVEFKDKALFAAIPHFASEDHITAEELTAAYTWLYYVWYSPDCITAFDLNKELMDYLGFSLPNDY